MAERQFGPYRLVRQIAVGGMAEIHLAKTKGIAGFEKYVAVKMIHPNFAEDEQFIQMLVDEAKIAVQLTHGNIAQTFDLGRVGSTYYITMEYIDGADLYKLLRKGSEVDLEMPLDICAFVAKEVASALDYAHRKKDAYGKPLGIVHRDVSPQNVLVSYAGEIKLVDFGIAKATSKAKQTAIGVIKGKYYYMSPEQAWGDPIDYRSDIFSAGIVLYEMITGQMLYLEEDLHRLLDMARKADIRPPSTLRAGIPPQLEKIVMHALAKVPGERYQSASDLATDLERFLHAYSPVFNAGKLSQILRQVVGEPAQIPAEEGFERPEVRDGPQSTQPLPLDAVAHSKEEIRDENSMIFHIDELQQSGNAPARPRTPPAGSPSPAKAPQAVVQGGFGKPTGPPIKKVPAVAPAPASNAAPRVTRAADPSSGPVRAPVRTPPGVPAMPVSKAPSGKIPSIAKAPTPAPGRPVVAPAPVAPARPSPARPRQLDEETREMGMAPGDVGAEQNEMSGLLTFAAPPASVGQAKPAAQAPARPRPPLAPPRPAPKAVAPSWADGADTQSVDEDLENIGDRTQITAAPRPSSYGTSDAANDVDDELRYDNPVDATMITGNARPATGPDMLDLEDQTRVGRGAASNDDDAPADDDDLAAAIDQALRNDTATQPAQADARRGDETDDEDDDQPTLGGQDTADEDGPTMQRDFREVPPPAKRAPRTSRQQAAAPPALAAKIHSPAVSELRKPRPSRRTPPGGIPAQQGGGGNVLQAIVGAQASEPMPTPRPMPAQPPPRALTPPVPAPITPPPMLPPPPMQQQLQPQPYAPPPYQRAPEAPPYQQPLPQTPPYGLPNGSPPLPGMQPLQQPPLQQPQYAPPPNYLGGQYPPHPYDSQQMPQMPQMPPPQAPPFGVDPMLQQTQQTQQQMYNSPGQLYAYQPFGVQPMPPTLTGQLRLSEGDELPAHMKIGGGKRWLGMTLAALVAISLAATLTFFLVRQTHDAAPTIGSIRVESSPPGAEIALDGQRLSDPTPFTIEGIPVGTRHEVKVSLAHYIGDTESVDVPKTGGEAQVTAILKPVTGKLIINSTPPNAEILLDKQNRGTTPKTITDVDMRAATHLELRLKDYQVYTNELSWPENGVITLDVKLVHGT